MATIQGAAYNIYDVAITSKSAHIEYTVGTKSVANNSTPVTVKCYVDNISGTGIPTISGRTLTLNYTGGTQVNVSITPNGSAIPVGASYLLGETTFNIPHGKSGSAKITTLTAYAQLFDGESFNYVSVSGEITLPKISNGHKKISGVWKNCFAWLKVLGTWKRCLIWQKINGVWKKGI